MDHERDRLVIVVPADLMEVTLLVKEREVAYTISCKSAPCYRGQKNQKFAKKSLWIHS
jgi:hypothetical protein